LLIDHRLGGEAELGGADELCRQFPTGGGRMVAAGINNLPEELFSEFITKFKETYN